MSGCLYSDSVGNGLGRGGRGRLFRERMLRRRPEVPCHDALPHMPHTLGSMMPSFLRPGPRGGNVPPLAIDIDSHANLPNIFKPPAAAWFPYGWITLWPHPLAPSEVSFERNRMGSLQCGCKPAISQVESSASFLPSFLSLIPVSPEFQNR